MANNDHWTLALGDLGMLGAGEELARLVLNCEPPYAICVQGKWGSGKTSLMRYAMARLGGMPLGTTVKASRDPIDELPDGLRAQWDDWTGKAKTFLLEGFESQGPFSGDQWKDNIHVVPIWFNPWQHQEVERPLIALLQELRAQLGYPKRLKDLGKYARIGVEAGLTILEDIMGVFSATHPYGALAGKGASALRGSWEHQRQRNFEEMHDAQRLNLLFEGAVERLLSTDVECQGSYCFNGAASRPVALRRLVVFVDDLDRCSEQQTVQLLEAIKLYLQTRYCVFVFGMDGAAARRAVATVLPHKSAEAQEYLEKLFQTTLQVPVPSGYGRFVERLLTGAGLTEEETGIAVSELAARIVQLVEPNPRKLKNFVNSLAVGWRVCKRCETPQLSFSIYLLTSFLRSYHPEVFRLLAYDPSLARDLNQVLFEGAAKLPAGVSPTFLFFHQTFRHAFLEAFGEGVQPTRKDADEIAIELIDRLDRHRGDRAFQELWKAEFGASSAEEVTVSVAAVLRADVRMAP